MMSLSTNYESTVHVVLVGCNFPTVGTDSQRDLQPERSVELHNIKPFECVVCLASAWLQ